MFTSPSPRRPITAVNLLSRNKSVSSKRRRTTTITTSTVVTPRSAPPVGASSLHQGEDRFIPNRRKMNIELCRRRLLLEEHNEETQQTTASTKSVSSKHLVKQEYKRRMLSSICNVPLNTLTENAQPRTMLPISSPLPSISESNSRKAPTSPFDPRSLDVLRFLHRIDDDGNANDSTTSTLLPSSKRRKSTHTRKIADQPWKVLDGPGLVNDFYINHTSWSDGNVLAIVLGSCVYLYHASTEEVEVLTEIVGTTAAEYATSVEWCKTHPSYLAIGTDSGHVEIWDTGSGRKVRTFDRSWNDNGLHRVAALSWNGQCLSSGGQDSSILHHDARSRRPFIAKYEGHEQEVCGMTWNEDGTALASGGNENMVCIWDAKMSSRRFSASDSHAVRPRLCLEEHKGAVKALDWCPHRRDMLASGGGTADQSIKLWNSNTGRLLDSVDTLAQVSQVIWSKHRLELCSSHGFPANSLCLWDCSGAGVRSRGLTMVKELTDHTNRVLSLACSPDGSTIVSVGGDERICFWDMFGPPPRNMGSTAIDMPMGELTFGMPTIR